MGSTGNCGGTRALGGVLEAAMATGDAEGSTGGCGEGSGRRALGSTGICSSAGDTGRCSPGAQRILGGVVPGQGYTGSCGSPALGAAGSCSSALGGVQGSIPPPPVSSVAPVGAEGCGRVSPTLTPCSHVPSATPALQRLAVLVSPQTSASLGARGGGDRDGCPPAGWPWGNRPAISPAVPLRQPPGEKRQGFIPEHPQGVWEFHGVGIGNLVSHLAAMPVCLLGTALGGCPGSGQQKRGGGRKRDRVGVPRVGDGC